MGGGKQNDHVLAENLFTDPVSKLESPKIVPEDFHFPVSGGK